MTEAGQVPGQEPGHVAATLTRKGMLGVALFATPVCLVVLAGVRYAAEWPAGPSLETGSVQLAGSETLRPVVAACAEEFMTVNPQADIVVKGGGSGDGVTALLLGIVDVGMTSRELSAKEREYARSKGIDVAANPLALDGITIVVNRANRVNALDLARVRDIFAGRIRYWRELGGGAEEIAVFARAAGSGTASLFDERVMAGAAHGAATQRLPTNEAIVAEVAVRAGAIGYSSFGAVRGAGDRITVVALSADRRSRPVAPTPDTIRAQTYPLTRTLYLNTAGTPSGTVKAFVDFCATGPGQVLLRKAGYVGVGPEAR